MNAALSSAVVPGSDAHAPASTQPSLMATLRAETKADHVATERCALSQAMAKALITETQYRLKLWVLRELYCALEFHADRAAGPLVHIWGPDLAKRSVLTLDLVQLGGSPEIPVEVHDAVNAATHAISVAAESDAELAGWLYVLEGSSLGGQVLLPRLERALGHGRGLEYYRGRGRNTRAHWIDFCERMNATFGRPSEHSAALLGARRAFAAIRSCFGSIDAVTGPALEVGIGGASHGA